MPAKSQIFPVFSLFTGKRWLRPASSRLPAQPGTPPIPDGARCGADSAAFFRSLHERPAGADRKQRRNPTLNGRKFAPGGSMVPGVDWADQKVAISARCSDQSDGRSRDLHQSKVKPTGCGQRSGCSCSGRGGRHRTYATATDRRTTKEA